MQKHQEGYEFRLIAWLDILGFREFIKDECNYSIVRRLIDDIQLQVNSGCQEITTLVSAPPGRAKSYRLAPTISFISDTIVLSYVIDEKKICPENMDGSMLLESVLEKISELQCKLLLNNTYRKYRLSIRGAITIGKVCHEQLHVFGPAINELYKYESECAIYPRVILTDSLIKKMPTDPLYGNFSAWLKKDLDGYYYVNFLLREDQLSRSRGGEETFFKMLEELKQVANTISKDLNKIDKINIAAKWKWLEEYIDRFMSFFLLRKNKSEK